MKKKIDLDIKEFPNIIQNLCNHANIYDSSCHSNAKVYYVDNGYYIKVGEINSLNNEYKMNCLFHKIGLGVEVVHYITTNNDYLVTKSAIGTDLTHCLENPIKLCEILAFSLNKLHSIPVNNVPFSSRYVRYIESLQDNFKNGYCDVNTQLNRYRINSRNDAINIINKSVHLLSADTLIHGDACLPNIIQKNNEFNCFIDFDMSGLGDKHIDLYWAIWSLQYNLKTDEYTDLFFDLYGREKIDENILRLIAAFELLG